MPGNSRTCKIDALDTAHLYRQVLRVCGEVSSLERYACEAWLITKTDQRTNKSSSHARV